MRVTFDPTIKLSDIVTTFSFVLAVIALVYSFEKDRDSANTARYTQARSIISSSLGQIQRWNDISNSIYHELQPVVIDVSQEWAKSGNILEARDLLWKKSTSINAGIQQRIIAEKIGVAYIELYNVDQQLAGKYLEMHDKITMLNSIHMSLLDADMQDEIYKFEHHKGVRITADMGNALRQAISKRMNLLEDLLKENEDSVRKSLLSRLEGPNTNLIKLENK